MGEIVCTGGDLSPWQIWAGLTAIIAGSFTLGVIMGVYWPNR